MKVFNYIIEIGWLLIFAFSPVFFAPFVHGTWQIGESFLFQVLVEILCFVWIIKLIGTPVRLWRTGQALEHWNPSPPLADGAGIGTLKKIFLKLKPVLPAIIFIFILGLAAIFSQSFHYSFWGYYSRKMGYLIWLHFFIFFLILFFNLKTKKQIARIFYIITLTASLVVIYGFLQVFGFDFFNWSEPPSLGYRVFSTLGQPNFLASWLLLSFPAVLWIIFRYSSQHHLKAPLFSTFKKEKKEHLDKTTNTSFLKKVFFRPIFVCLSLLTVIILVLTQSRGGWIGFFLALFFFIIIFSWQKNQKRLAILLFIFLVLFSFFILALNMSPLQIRPTDHLLTARVKTLSHLTDAGRLRFIWWQNSFDLIKQKPVLGFGPETQHLNFPQYYEPEYAALEGINQMPDRAHNDILDMTLMSGILGLISYLFLIFWVFFSGLKYIFQKSHSEFKVYSLRFIVLVLLAGLTGYLISLQFSFHVIPTAVYFWGYLAIILNIISTKQQALNNK
ncbi:O-antigen ligase family protein [Patescibacteria group bacterium]|nr:O-antigen ligase family protein [Patescibacteria group bacterium]